MSENVFPHYRTDTFAMVGTGFSAAPTITARYVRKDHEVTVYLPAFTATSGAVTFTLTGLPEEIWPTQALIHTTVVHDNGANVQGVMILAADSGTITLGEGGYVAGGFTGSGAKGLPGNALTYLSIPR